MGTYRIPEVESAWKRIKELLAEEKPDVQEIERLFDKAITAQDYYSRYTEKTSIRAKGPWGAFI